MKQNTEAKHGGIKEFISKFTNNIPNLSEFGGHINNWIKLGLISEEEGEEMLESLNDPDVKLRLKIFIEQYITFTLFHAGITGAAGALILEDPAYGIIVGESVRMAIKNIFIQIRGNAIPKIERQKLALFSMPMHIGDLAHFSELHKSHPTFVKNFYIYLRTRILSNILDDTKEQKELTSRQKIYLSLNDSNGNEASQEDLEELLKKRFEKHKRRADVIFDTVIF